MEVTAPANFLLSVSETTHGVKKRSSVTHVQYINLKNPLLPDALDDVRQGKVDNLLPSAMLNAFLTEGLHHVHILFYNLRNEVHLKESDSHTKQCQINACRAVNRRLTCHGFTFTCAVSHNVHRANLTLLLGEQ